MQNRQFKFKFVNNEGKVMSFFSMQASLGDDGYLNLGDVRIKFSDITDTTTRDNRLIISIFTGAALQGSKCHKYVQSGEGCMYVIIEVYKIKAIELERAIDRISSLSEIEECKLRLKEEGNESLFRVAVCPDCGASINLTELDKTPHTYCRFCETIFDNSLNIVAKGSEYRLCDECNMFDRVKGYTECYFYFLVFIYGYSYKRRHLCDHCVNGVFLKTLFMNLIFVLGVIPSVYLKIKSLIGRDSKMKKMSIANSLAKKRKYEKAIMIYEEILIEYPGHPGVLYNMAIAGFTANDAEAGADLLMRSLGSCCNYLPSLQLAHQLSSTE